MPIRDGDVAAWDIDRLASDLSVDETNNDEAEVALQLLVMLLSGLAMDGEIESALVPVLADELADTTIERRLASADNVQKTDGVARLIALLCVRVDGAEACDEDSTRLTLAGFEAGDFVCEMV